MYGKTYFIASYDGTVIPPHSLAVQTFRSQLHGTAYCWLVSLGKCEFLITNVTTGLVTLIVVLALDVIIVCHEY